MRSFWTTSCISKYSNANSSNFHQCHPLLIRQSLWNVGQVYLQQRAFINHWVLRNHWKLLFDLVVYENQSQTKFSSTYDSSSYLWHHFSSIMYDSFCLARTSWTLQVRGFPLSYCTKCNSRDTNIINWFNLLYRWNIYWKILNSLSSVLSLKKKMVIEKIHYTDCFIIFTLQYNKIFRISNGIQRGLWKNIKWINSEAKWYPFHAKLWIWSKRNVTAAKQVLLLHIYNWLQFCL